MPKRRSDRAIEREVTRERSRSDVTFEFLTDKQRAAWEAYQTNDVIFLTGPAGTGKSFLATAFAIRDILQRVRKKIILTRPIVEAGESLGYLPGTFNEKVSPYMSPLFDCYHVLCPGATLKNKVIESAFEVAPLAFMRGRTMTDAVCILDEAQNATPSQIKLFLTRLGTNSKMIITGDPRQSDLRERSGMVGVMDKLSDLEGVEIVRFTNSDIVRHSLVGKIIDRLESE
jgi:phosphate starvation-inducible PhoH-like protein